MAPLKKVDAVIVGVGWAGGIIASELTRAGLNVVGLERPTKHRLRPFRRIFPMKRRAGRSMALAHRRAAA